MENNNRGFLILLLLVVVVGFIWVLCYRPDHAPTAEFKKKYFHPPGGGSVNVIPHREVETLIPTSNLSYTQFRFMNDIHAQRDLAQFLKMCGIASDWVETRYHNKPFFIVVLTHLDAIDFRRDSRYYIPSWLREPPYSRAESSLPDGGAILITWTNAIEMKGSKPYITKAELEAAQKQKPSIITRWLQPFQPDKPVNFTLWGNQDPKERISIWSGSERKKLSFIERIRYAEGDYSVYDKA